MHPLGRIYPGTTERTPRNMLWEIYPHPAPEILHTCVGAETLLFLPLPLSERLEAPGFVCLGVNPINHEEAGPLTALPLR